MPGGRGECVKERAGVLRVRGSDYGHPREQAGRRSVAAKRELSGGSTEDHAYRELGLGGRAKRRSASVRGMVSHIWIRSSRGHAGLRKTAAAHSSGGSSEVARGN